MKQLVIFTITLAFLLTSKLVQAQKLTPQTLKSMELANHKKVISQALTYSDAQTAINSMHAVIALEGKESTYKDSLAITYFKTGNYISSHLLAKELLTNKPKNAQLLEINAVSLQQLNATKEAIAAYEVLFVATKNMAHGYQLANLQYGIKRLAEAQETINQTVQCKELENAFMQFSIDKNQNQNVPLKAAAYNLQGLIAFELKDHTEAIKAFSEALKIMPEFTIATQNANAVVVENQNKSKKD